jgi:hypothetical protein
LKPNRDRLTFDGKIHASSRINRNASFQERKTLNNNKNISKAKIEEDEGFMMTSSEDKLFEKSNI